MSTIPRSRKPGTPITRPTLKQLQEPGGLTTVLYKILHQCVLPLCKVAGEDKSGTFKGGVDKDTVQMVQMISKEIREHQDLEGIKLDADEFERLTRELINRKGLKLTKKELRELIKEVRETASPTNG